MAWHGMAWHGMERWARMGSRGEGRHKGMRGQPLFPHVLCPSHHVRKGRRSTVLQQPRPSVVSGGPPTTWGTLISNCQLPTARGQQTRLDSTFSCTILARHTPKLLQAPPAPPPRAPTAQQQQQQQQLFSDIGECFDAELLSLPGNAITSVTSTKTTPAVAAAAGSDLPPPALCLLIRHLWPPPRRSQTSPSLSSLSRSRLCLASPVYIPPGRPPARFPPPLPPPCCRT